LILKGLAVDEETVVVVEVDVRVAIGGGRRALLSGWSGWRRDVGMAPPAGLDGWWALAFEAGATWAEVWVQRTDWPKSWLEVRWWEAATGRRWPGGGEEEAGSSLRSE
jgi:hypothetical protein